LGFVKEHRGKRIWDFGLRIADLRKAKSRRGICDFGFLKSKGQRGFGIEALRDWELVKAKSLAPQ